MHAHKRLTPPGSMPAVSRPSSRSPRHSSFVARMKSSGSYPRPLRLSIS
jgi:hypothetical protein